MTVSIYDTDAPMRQFQSVVPDKEWTFEWRDIAFDVPDEVDAIVRDSSLPIEKRMVAYLQIMKYAKVEIEGIVNRPDLAEMEIDLNHTMGRPRRNHVQETMDEIADRNANRLGLPSITALMRSNKVSYVIAVWARRRKRLFVRFPDELGPQDGFEAMSDLPEDIVPHAAHVFDEGRPA